MFNPYFKNSSSFALCAVLLLTSTINITQASLSQKEADQIVTFDSVCSTNDTLCRSLSKELELSTAKFHGNVGIFFKDLKTGKTVAINKETLFPSASLVKVPIMVAVFEAEKEGKLTLSKKLKLQNQYKSPGGGYLYETRAGRSFTILNLVERMITQSDNTATNMLVAELGFDYLNKKFEEFGLINTNMRRGILDLKSRNEGIENYTTANDMAFLLEKIFNRELISAQASQEMLDILKNQRVNDRIPRYLPKEVAIAHKTGTLKDTYSDVGIVFAPEGAFLLCVLTDEVTNKKYAKRFISKIAKTTYEYHKTINSGS